jgi:hypothetical protein
VLEVALCILSLSNLNVNLAVEWIFRRKRRGLPVAPGVTHEVCTLALEQFALTANMDFILDAGCRENSPFPAALKVATLVVRGCDMEQFVSSANREHGTVVTSYAFTRHWNAENLARPLHGADIRRPDASGDQHAQNAASACVYRWRSRHGFKIGALRLQEPLSLSAKREKAEPNITKNNKNKTVFRVPKRTHQAATYRVYNENQTRGIYVTRHTGSENGPHMSIHFTIQWSLEAVLALSWAAHITDHARAGGKIPLIINMDESPIPMCQVRARGNIKRFNPHTDGNAPRQQATRSMTRQYQTLAAFICNIAAVQRLLPQIIIADKHHITYENWPVIMGHIQDPIYFLRQDSGWNNSATLCNMVRLLALILNQAMPGSHTTPCGPEPTMLTQCQIILQLDSAKAHVTRDVLTLLALLSWRLLLVPALLTWMLQPLDVKVFAIFKRALRNRAVDEARTAAGEHYIVRTNRQLALTIQEVLHSRNWSGIFRRLGYNGDTPPISKTLLKELGWDAAPVLPRTRPTLADIRTVWPKKAFWNDDVVATILPPLPVVPLVAAPADAPAVHGEALEEPDPAHAHLAAAAGMHVAAFGGHPGGAGRGIRLLRKTSAGY